MTTTAKDWFSQSSYRCRLEWGRRGARVAAERGDILVVVDVLSFSTVAVTAVSRGATLYPCAKTDDSAALAARVGGEVAVAREDAPAKGRFSLSPQTFLKAKPGTRVVLPSPNGATCTRYGRQVPHLFVGALVNAEAVAAAIGSVLSETDSSVTLLACGERWSDPTDTAEDGELRFALEDYLGAGAILAHLPAALSRSPEARAAEAIFHEAGGEVDELLYGCGSGVELIARGYESDVRHAAQLNQYTVVPRLRDGERLEG
jgi:2-phosphosulfolactate phosphatase